MNNRQNNKLCVCEHPLKKHNSQGICREPDCDCDEFYVVEDQREYISSDSLTE